MDTAPGEDKKTEERMTGEDVERASGDGVSLGKGDILQLEHTDPVLNAKMHLINNVCWSLFPVPFLRANRGSSPESVY